MAEARLKNAMAKTARFNAFMKRYSEAALKWAVRHGYVNMTDADYPVRQALLAGISMTLLEWGVEHIDWSRP